METTRLNYAETSPDLYKALLGLEAYVHSSELEDSLLELVKLRASQINRCGWCIDMHTKDALANGETAQRLFLVSAWSESPQFSHREKLALEWCETITNIPQHSVDDKLYMEMKEEFGNDGLVALTAAVVAINSWNRFNVAFGAIPGTYKRNNNTIEK
ncbi:MAG: carboxymuconolactone decarboxylase family protein [Thermoplasmataceae archaeon]